MSDLSLIKSNVNIPGDKESLKVALAEISETDADFIGDNGDDYLWDDARAAGFETNFDYVFDQIVEENNPVIIDLKFLEKQGEKQFRQAGEILKLLRHQYGAEAILLSQTEDKNLIIVTPSRVKLVRKD